MHGAPRLPRALLAEDLPEVSMRIAKTLSGEIEIVGSVSDGSDLIAAAARLDPDVVVLDISMPGLHGIEAARQLRRVGCRAKLVFLTAHEEHDYVCAALDAGGAAYVVKARLASDLVTAIREGLAGRRFVSPTGASR